MDKSADDFTLMFLTFSLHVGAVGVFLLIVKTTIWDISSLLWKIVILTLLYFSYAFLIGPNVEDVSRLALGLPSREAETAEEAEKQKLPNVLPEDPGRVQPVLR